MIKIENVVLASPEQMEFIIQGMRNPKNSWEKSDSSCGTATRDTNVQWSDDYFIGTNDANLMLRLSNAGTEHRKYMRMMPVYARITAPLYWWKEFDTYKVGTVANSCSTMHKIAAKEFDRGDFSTEHLVSGWMDKDKNGTDIFIPGPLEKLDSTIKLLNNIREKYLNALKNNQETFTLGYVQYLGAKDIWWQMIQLLPSSYNQTRNVMLNYEVLANIYRQRKGHKLDEWIAFCNWIENLPYSELITGKEKKDECY